MIDRCSPNFVFFEFSRWLDDNSWSDGGAAQYPEGTKAVGMSSFEVLDWLSDHALKKYHNAESLVISGHSMGGQLAQRYAFLGKGIKSNVKVSYFMGNPGSYLYLNEDRPVKVDNCTGIDDYKYGLSSGLPDYVEMDPIGGREAIFQRGMGRTLNFVIGSEDYGPGDIRCQAEGEYGFEWVSWAREGRHTLPFFLFSPCSDTSFFLSWTLSLYSSHLFGCSPREEPQTKR